MVGSVFKLCCVCVWGVGVGITVSGEGEKLNWVIELAGLGCWK